MSCFSVKLLTWDMDATRVLEALAGAEAWPANGTLAAPSGVMGAQRHSPGPFSGLFHVA